MDIFAAAVPPSDQHHNFVAIQRPEYAPERRVIESWAAGFVDRDHKFVHEFQTTFNSCFWELYLHACFRELGFAFDWSHPMPDFVLASARQAIVAEAAIASHADGYVAEWERDLADGRAIDHHEMIRSASLRLSNAFTSKLTAYRNRYASLDHVRGKPFVLCLAAYDQPYFFLQKDNAIRRVLYGLEQPLWIPGKDGDRIVVGESRRPSEVKDSGAEVGFGLFAKPGCEEISAVVFSSTATFGKVHALADSSVEVVFHATRYNDHGTEPLNIVARRGEYCESLLDGLHVFLNPFATCPLDIAPWLRPEVAVHSLDAKTGDYSCEIAHAHLFARLCHVHLARETADAPPQVRPIVANDKKKPHVRKEWPEGKLVSVPGDVMTFVDTHLAHYNGWTLAVVFDTVDRNWGWLAHTGAARTLSELMTLNGSDEGTAQLCSEWFETKEAAFADAKRAIDSGTVA